MGTTSARSALFLFLAFFFCFQSALAQSDTLAVIMVDQRLYALLKDDIDQYAQLAAQRRGFGIFLDNTENLDDFTYDQIRRRILDFRNRFTQLEGVLAIGNIKLPSFYKVRGDILHVRLYPAYYEDFDLNLSRYYQSGAVDPYCVNGDDGFCQVLYEDGYAVPEHDFDLINYFPTTPDIWTCYMPVGKSEESTYLDFAAQLQPYFEKLLSFYNGMYLPENKMYMVSNDLYGGDYNFWQLYGDVHNVDFYAMNPSTDTTCIESGRTAEECYQRAQLENYPSHEAFMEEYNSRYWMGEGWQKDSIYTAHMLAGNYEFVLVNVHSWEQAALISSAEADTLHNGGMIMIGLGCSTAGFRQPGSPSNVETATYPDDNILLSYLYGTSHFLTALGSPFYRGHAGHFEQIIDVMKNDGEYLGRAHWRRMRYLYENAQNEVNLKEQINEMLLGDPFLDAQPPVVSALPQKSGSTMLSDVLLLNNYPNPFNPQTVIRYRLPAFSAVELTVYNILGQKIATLVNGEQQAGKYSVRFDAAGLPAGVYIYRLKAGRNLQQRKMLLLR